MKAGTIAAGLWLCALLFAGPAAGRERPAVRPPYLHAGDSVGVVTISSRTDTLRRTVVATGKVEPRDEVLIKRYQETRRAHPLSPRGRVDTSGLRASFKSPGQ